MFQISYDNSSLPVSGYTIFLGARWKYCESLFGEVGTGWDFTYDNEKNIISFCLPTEADMTAFKLRFE